MQIIGHMVTRNEMDRYLPAVITALGDHVDRIVAYDDRSDDGTPEYLHDEGVIVGRRQSGAASFADHEAQFRQAAWNFLEVAARPEKGDWILCLDADEFLILGNFPSLARALRDIPFFTNYDTTALRLGVDEVFGVRVDGTPMIRTDGFWGSIANCRLVRWRAGGTFASIKQGGGSVPWEWARNAVTVVNPSILHFGYARGADRKAKYERYRSSAGHHPAHVRSIIEPGELVPLAQPVPEMLVPILARWTDHDVVESC